MQEVDKIIRAWKDEDYRLSLSNEDLSGLPENPAGLVELSDAALKDASGGTIVSILCPTAQIMCISPLCVPSFVGPCLTKPVLCP
jgi:mersacidin/lichenicidin family type 2 lantibiotic